jgi:acetoacetate decarboxylase
MDRARAWVPPELALVPVLPGRTLGGLYYAAYGAGSSLQYNELIVIAGLVRHRLRIGGWISHIYVDESRSIAAGREIWSLPKERALFSGSYDSGLTVSQGSEVLCRLHGERPSHRLPIPLLAPVISKGKGKLHWFRGAGTALCSIGKGAIEVPDESPFADLGLVQGRGIYLERLSLSVYAPGR